MADKLDLSQVEPEKRKRNPRTKKGPPKAASALLAAINFVALAGEKDSKRGWPQYTRFVNNWATASNGMLSAGHPIEEDLTLCPHIERLRDAINRAGSSIAITALDSGRLSVVGGPSKFVVPCMPGEHMPPVQPDMNIAPISDKLKEGFAAVLKCAREDAETIVESSLLLRANTVVATNRQLLLEFWHGIDLPPGLAVPQPFAKAIVNAASPLVGFGWTPGRSVTFWFENGAWLKTQLMQGEWPDVDRVLNMQANYEDCPERLFEAIETVSSFSNDGAVHFHEDKVKSSYGSMNDEGKAIHGASFDVPGLVGGSHFTAKLFKLAQHAAKQIDYKTHDDRMMIMNNDEWIRGVIMKRSG